jgi:excisionase family DNA binding protein
MNTKTNEQASANEPLTLPQIRERATLSVAEAGRLLGMGRDASYRAAKRGDLPAIQIGRRLIVPVPRLLVLLGEG